MKTHAAKEWEQNGPIIGLKAIRIGFYLWQMNALFERAKSDLQIKEGICVE